MTNFYKQNGSYFTQSGQKILNPTELQGYAKAGGKEVSAPNIPQGATKISGPSGLQGLNESQLYRSGQDIYRLPDMPKVPSHLPVDELSTGENYDNLPQPEFGNLDSLMAGTKATQDGLKSYLEQQQAQLKSQTDFDATKQRLNDFAEENKTAQRDLQEKTWKRFGLEPNVEQLQKLAPQMAALQASFDNGEIAQEGKVASASSIYGRQALIRRQKAVEMAGLGSMAQAYQGNIDMARTLTQDAINAKYADQEMYINNLQNQMNYISENLNREETVKLNSLSAVLVERERNIAIEKEKEMNISNIMLAAAQKGADQETLQKIMKATSYTDAIRLASAYLDETESSWTESDVLDSEGNPMLFNPVTGEYKTSVGTSTSDIFFTDANGDSWNIAGWATDQTKPQQMNAIADRIGKVTEENIAEKVKEFTPGLTPEMIKEASAQSGVSWEAIMTMVNQEAQGGLSNVAKNNNNFGGLTFNNQEWIKEFGGEKGTSRPSAEGGNYIKFPTKQAGLNAMANLMAQYGKVDTILQQPDEVSGLVELVRTGQLTAKEALGYVSEKNRTILTKQLGKIEIEKIVSSYTEEMKNRTLESVDELLTQVNPYTVGFGVLVKGVPTSQARSFSAQLDTLKANIAFGELTAMREASKTGGALGQVSDREGKLLANALGALDQGQSPEQFKAQLEKIKNSINKWKQEVNQYSSQSNISTVDLTDLNFKFE